MVKRRNQRGLSLLILTSMAVPLARSKVRGEKERELRRALLEMRNAIDKYKDMADQGLLGPQKLGAEGYPPSLEVLVEGVKMAGQMEKKMRFLRRIPKDPMTHTTDWGKRSMQDDPKSIGWGGQNVFDVYTNSTDRAGDGTSYSEW
jgi:general secretion pathway protein G